MEFGKWYTSFMLWVALVIALCLWYCAWQVRSVNTHYDKSTKALVEEATCDKVKKEQYDCTVDATFNDDENTEYEVRQMELTSARPLQSGDTVRIRYSSRNPEDVKPTRDLPSINWANILCVSGVLVLLLAAFRLYLSKRFNFVAAGSGVMGAFRV